MVTSGGGLHVYMKTLGQMGARGRVCVTVLETTPASIGALEACVELSRCFMGFWVAWRFKIVFV